VNGNYTETSKTSVKLYENVGIVKTMFTIRETTDGKTNEVSYALLDVWRKETNEWKLLTRFLEEMPARATGNP
jgi:ketosteroid isomerase-like protein